MKSVKYKDYNIELNVNKRFKEMYILGIIAGLGLLYSIIDALINGENITIYIVAFVIILLGMLGAYIVKKRGNIVYATFRENDLTVYNFEEVTVKYKDITNIKSGNKKIKIYYKEKGKEEKVYIETLSNFSNKKYIEILEKRISRIK